ncbi:SHOCT domain-containing protein [Halomicrococcus gelatinilyticus]|uniref:SHOCT domain-containing protein n=1 Tax=Halomicrococcus gelatinilyticus TaxID=1702103 RepID=UPI002E141386
MERNLRQWRRSAVAGTALGALALPVAFAGVALAHGGDDGLHHHDGWMGTHGGVGGWMGDGTGLLWLLAVGLLLVVVGLVLYAALSGRSGSDRDGRPGNRTEDAMAVLRRRYAQGEIDEDEFERRRARLETDGGRATDGGRPTVGGRTEE